MIKNLTGVYETVEYENKRVVMLHDNVETEAYPTHWHNAVEIIIPLTNDFTVVSGDKEYVLKEKEILIIPPGELHSMPARVVVKIAHTVGALQELLCALSNSEISVEYMYGLSASGNDSSVVIKTNKLDEAKAIVIKKGLSLMTSEELINL